jgi:hypothetical protein
VHGGVEIDKGDSRTPKKYLISEQSSAVLDFFFVSFFCVKTKERKVNLLVKLSKNSFLKSKKAL